MQAPAGRARAARRSARRASTPLCSTLILPDLVPCHHHRSDGLERAVADGAEEAVVASGMAGDAGLVDQDQQRVAVAVDPEIDQRSGCGPTCRPCATAPCASATSSRRGPCALSRRRRRDPSRPSSGLRRYRAAGRSPGPGPGRRTGWRRALVDGSRQIASGQRAGHVAGHGECVPWPAKGRGRIIARHQLGKSGTA